MRASAVGMAATVAVALMSFPTLNSRVLAAGDVSAPNVVKQTNDVRSRNGLGQLRVDALLMKAAQAKADDMAARVYFAHQTPDGRMPWDWIAAVGYQFTAAAENLAVGYPTDADLIAAWMESEGHRHNLLNQKYTDIGIGIARGRYKGQDTIFVVQLFGKPLSVLRTAALASTPIPVELRQAPSLALASADLNVDPALLAALPLEAEALPLDVVDFPTLPLEAHELTVEGTDAPALALPSTDLPFDPALPPAATLFATDIPFGPAKLPTSVLPSVRTRPVSKPSN